MNKKDEQLIQFYTKYNVMSAEEQQLMELGFINLFANSNAVKIRLGIVLMLTLLAGILIGHYLV